MSYSDFMTRTASPYIAHRRTVRELVMRDGKKLYGESYSAENARGTVFILHGFTENAAKYGEVIYRFLRENFCVFIYEQRGHGRSHRAVADKTLTHIDRFEEYVEDFETVLEQAADMPKPYFLFSHSMGGAVSALFMEKHPGVFGKAVMSSPMIAPTHGNMPLFLHTHRQKAQAHLHSAKVPRKRGFRLVVRDVRRKVRVLRGNQAKLRRFS